MRFLIQAVAVSFFAVSISGLAQAQNRSAELGQLEKPGDVATLSPTLLEILQSEDAPGLAYAMVRPTLNDAQWQKIVKEYETKYRNWKEENDGDMSDYLGQRLIIIALGAAGGEVDKIQKALVFMAMYHEFNQSAPTIVNSFMKEHQSSMSRLLNGFSWNKATDYVKAKRWREDIEERKRKEAIEKASGKKKKSDETPTPVSMNRSND